MNLSHSLNKRFYVAIALVISVVLALFYLVSVTPFGYASDLSKGERIIDSMIKNYSSYKSYHDRGKVTVNIYRGKKEVFTRKKLFQTYYIKPLYFLISWVDVQNSDEPKLNIVWRNDAGIFFSLKDDEPDKYTDINTALSAAAGVSNGISYLVPKYLLEEVPCQKLNGAVNIELLSDDKEYIVRLDYPQGRSEKLWLDKNTYTILKLEKWRQTGKGSRVQHIIEFTNIRINEDVDEEIFKEYP